MTSLVKEVSIVKKNTVLLNIIIVLIAIIICSFIYCFHIYRKNISINNNKKVVDCEINNILGKFDYPLIDIYFDNDNEWLVIDRKYLFTSQEMFYTIQKSRELELSKEWLKIITFPVGRGTTPNGIIYVYKDKNLIKEVPYLEIYYETKLIMNLFKQVTKNEIENIINNELPPPI